MKNIIYVNGRFLSQRQTGVQKFALQQLNILAEYFDVVVLVPYNADFSNLSKKISVTKVGKLKGHLWEQVSLYLYLKSLDNPMLITFSGLPPLLYRQSIFTIHDLSFKFEPSWFNFYYRLWYGFAYYLSTKFAKGIITVSEFSKNEIEKYYPSSAGKLHIVYNISPGIVGEMKKTSYKSDYILLVSSLDPRKNISSYIDAFIDANLHDYKLVIVGGGGDAFKFKFPDEIRNNVVFAGYVDDFELMNLYEGASAFVYPSLYEGFGIPPLEAMSVGCPCIVSSVASIPEVCGDAVLYFDPYSKDSMSEATKQILTDLSLRENLVKKGYNRLHLIHRQSKKYGIIKVINESFASK